MAGVKGSRDMDGEERGDNGCLLGTVANLQRMSTEDGPGIRTTVFFKGCSLACTWCHNPECIQPEPQLVWHRIRCIGCGVCAAVCPSKAVNAGPDGVVIDRERCTACGTCAEACPSTAMELIGKRWGVEELFAELVRDRAYFSRSGGGITLSGGEPALQVSFVEALLARCGEAGIHTALDTSGMCGEEALLRLARHANLVLYDIKEIDDTRHRKFTGQRNGRILDNLRSLTRQFCGGGRPLELWIRTPLVPGATARDENIHGIGKFISSELGGRVSRWELCGFNNLCRDKYERLGLTWEFEEALLLSKEELEHYAEVARGAGVPQEKVVASGATCLETNGQTGVRRLEAPA